MIFIIILSHYSLILITSMLIAFELLHATFSTADLSRRPHSLKSDYGINSSQDGTKSLFYLPKGGRDENGCRGGISAMY